jgi:hypothetical protein
VGIVAHTRAERLKIAADVCQDDNAAASRGSAERRSRDMSQPPERNDAPNPLDPFGFWKQSQQATLDSWSKAMTEAVNTDAYAETTGRMLDTYLTAAAPLRKVLEQTMTQLLNQLGLPSRAEVVSIAERMTNIELRLDDLDARLDVLHRDMERVASAVAALSAATAAQASAIVDVEPRNGAQARKRAPASRRGPATQPLKEAKTTPAPRASTGRARRKAE